jgi:hypothetical protein
MSTQKYAKLHADFKFVEIIGKKCTWKKLLAENFAIEKSANSKFLQFFACNFLKTFCCVFLNGFEISIKFCFFEYLYSNKILFF